MNIIITGASRGIGFEITKKLSNNSENNIIVISRNKKKLELLVDECKKENKSGNVESIAFDLEKIEAIPMLAETIKKQFNKVDIIINNAGYLVNKALTETTPSDIEKVYKINVMAPYELIRTMLPILENSDNAHIVNISSMGGFQGSAKFPGLSAYSSSKAAIASLTECLAEEFKETNMRFNCLALGAVATEMLAEAFPGYEAPSTAAEMAEYIADFALNGHKTFNGKIIPVSKSTP